MKLNGSNVSDEFAIRADGRYEGELDGLRLGGNVISATAPGADSDQVAIRNHPNGGPVFSGPQVQPWVCQNGAKDAQCNAPATYDYQYKSSVDGAVRSPTTRATRRRTSPRRPRDQGKTVPFIVRIETGYQDRDQYKIAVLYRPGQAVDGVGPAAAVQPQAADHPRRELRHRPPERGRAERHERHGGGRQRRSNLQPDDGARHGLRGDVDGARQRRPQLQPRHPGRVAGDGQGAPDRAATATLRYTIGTGCSGGSLAQQQVANAYPGIYQGILPQCCFPDAWSTGQQLADYHLDPPLLREPDQVGAGRRVDPDADRGGRGPPQPRQRDRLRHGLLDVARRPDDGCPGVPADQTTTTPQTNPGGVRCTLADYMINVFGPRPAERVERRRASSSATASPACRSTTSASSTGSRRSRRARSRPAQFVDLNAKIGGADIDINPTAERFDGQPAGAAQRLPQRRRSTRPTTSTGVAIIDLRGPDPGAFHDAYRSWAIRARLEREEGHFPRNHVIWFGAGAADRRPELHDRGPAGDGPLARRGRGATSATVLARSRRSPRTARPTSTTAARTIDGVEQVAVPGVGPVCELTQAQTRFGTPRDGRRREHRDRHATVPAQAAARSRLLPDRRSPTTSGRRCRRRSRPASATGASRASTSRARSRGRPTRTRRRQRRSTAASPSAPRRPGPAAAGPARRSPHGATQAAEGLGRAPRHRSARRASGDLRRARAALGAAPLLSHLRVS